MSDAEAVPEKPKGGKLRKLVGPVAMLALGGVSFAATFLGILPLEFGSHGGAADAHIAAPAVVFVEVPTIEVLIPGTRNKSLIVSASIETTAAEQAAVTHLMPRVSDVFTTFLSSVDAAAYERRGVLEIIRAELVTRVRYVLGDEPVKDLLITEFRTK